MAKTKELKKRYGAKRELSRLFWKTTSVRATVVSSRNTRGWVSSQLRVQPAHGHVRPYQILDLIRPGRLK